MITDLPRSDERRLVIATHTGDVRYQNFDASFELRYIRAALACAGWTILASVRNVRPRSAAQ